MTHRYFKWRAFSSARLLAAAATVLIVLTTAGQASARPLVFVQDLTVEEGDSTTARTIDFPITFANAINLRVRIVVSVAPLGPRVTRFRPILPDTFTRTLNGNGVLTIPICVRGDLNREPDAIATVRLTFISGLIAGGDTGKLTLRDDDHPTVTVRDSFALEGGSDDLPDGPRHQILLSKAINQPTRLRAQTVSTTALPGRDFTAVNEIITIPAGAVEAFVTVRVIDDNVIDLDFIKEYLLIVSPVRVGDIAIGGDLAGLGRINDDEPAIVQEAIFQLEGDPEPPNFLNGTVANCRSALPTDEPFNSSVDRRFKLTFAVGFPNPFEVRFISTSGAQPGDATAGSDFDQIDEVRTFQPGRTGIFTVRIHDDGVTEGDETFRIEAVSRVIRQARPCGFQNLLGAQSDIKINGNLF